MERVLTPTASFGLHLTRQGLWFAAVGGGAALGYIGLSGWLLSLSLPIAAWLISALSYAFFIGPVYWAHHRLTFQSLRPHREALPRYVATQLTALALTALAAVPVYHWWELPPIVGGSLIIGATSAGSFLALNFWTFATSKAR